MRLFNIPEWVTFIGVTILMTVIVITGRYWTFERSPSSSASSTSSIFQRLFWAMKTGNVNEGWLAVGKGFWPGTPTGLGGVALLTLIMANIGTTITPWQIFFQQSAVVDKGMDIRDIRYGKIDTLVGSFTTCVVAAFIIIATAGVFFYHPGGPLPVESAAQTAALMPTVMPAGTHWGQWARVLFAIGLFDAGLLGLSASLSAPPGPWARFLAGRIR